VLPSRLGLASLASDVRATSGQGFGLPAGEAGLRRRLTPLAAAVIAFAAWPYVEYCPARRTLAGFASEAQERQEYAG